MEFNIIMNLWIYEFNDLTVIQFTAFSIFDYPYRKRGGGDKRKKNKQKWTMNREKKWKHIGQCSGLEIVAELQ